MNNNSKVNKNQSNNTSFNKTQLEQLIESCYFLKSEVTGFLGIEYIQEKYQDVNVEQAIAEKEIVEQGIINSERKKCWYQERLMLINDHLLSHNFSLSIAGDFSDYNIRLGQYPSLQLKLDKILLHYYWGPFLNRFVLSSLTHDVLQIEPTIKLFYPLKLEQYAQVQNDIDIVTAELTQHQITI
jgi:hypothetical protein